MTASDIKTPEVEALLRLLATTTDPDDIFNLLQDLCTIREITDMSQRLEVARLLAAKVSYTEIQNRTGASSTTISRVSKCLNYGAGGYARAVQLQAEEGECA